MLDRLRDRVQVFLEAVARERYELIRTPLPRVGLGALYARSAELFSLERISHVQRAVSESSGLAERRARFLLEALVRGRALCAAAAELDQRLTFEVFGSIAVGERRLAVRDAEAFLAEAAEPEVRHAVEDAWLDALVEEDPPLQALLNRQRDVYDELGYGPLVEACSIVSGIDLRGLAREGEQFLDETEGVYRELLAWYLPRIAGVDPAEATAADALRLESAAPFLDDFPAADALRDTQRLLAQCGLDPFAQGRIHVERRPELTGGRAAVCCPLEVPDTVVVILSPRAGRRAHAEILEAFGCALHHAYVSPELPLEFRWLGDRSVPLASGLLVRGLLRNAAFLRDRYQIARQRAAEYRRLAALLLLLGLRRRIALLQVANAGAEEGARVDPVRDLYVERLSRATGVRHDARHALRAMGLPFEFAWRVRAEQLAAVEAGYLRERYDEDWYRNPSAGGALADLLGHGQEYTASELAVQLTSAPPSFDPVLAATRELLG